MKLPDLYRPIGTSITRESLDKLNQLSRDEHPGAAYKKLRTKVNHETQASSRWSLTSDFVVLCVPLDDQRSRPWADIEASIAAGVTSTRNPINVLVDCLTYLSVLGKGAPGEVMEGSTLNRALVQSQLNEVLLAYPVLLDPCFNLALCDPAPGDGHQSFEWSTVMRALSSIPGARLPGRGFGITEERLIEFAKHPAVARGLGNNPALGEMAPRKKNTPEHVLEAAWRERQATDCASSGLFVMTLLALDARASANGTPPFVPRDGDINKFLQVALADTFWEMVRQPGSSHCEAEYFIDFLAHSSPELAASVRRDLSLRFDEGFWGALPMFGPPKVAGHHVFTERVTRAVPLLVQCGVAADVRAAAQYLASKSVGAGRTNHDAAFANADTASVLGFLEAIEAYGASVDMEAARIVDAKRPMYGIYNGSVAAWEEAYLAHTTKLSMQRVLSATAPVAASRPAQSRASI